VFRSSPASHPSFQDLETEADLDRALAASHSHPILLYKHSRTCGSSGYAAEEIATWLDAAAPTPIAVHTVRIQAARPVSQAIASRFGVRHESPQVLLISEGTVRWHASHFSITADAIDAAVRGVTGVHQS
jgi:thioredoxin 1